MAAPDRSSVSLAELVPLELGAIVEVIVPEKWTVSPPVGAEVELYSDTDHEVAGELPVPAPPALLFAFCETYHWAAESDRGQARRTRQERKFLTEGTAAK